VNRFSLPAVVKVGDVRPFQTNLCLVVRVLEISAVAATASHASWVAVVGDESASIDLVVTRTGTWDVDELVAGTPHVLVDSRDSS
jgi:hypothetical protein